MRRSPRIPLSVPALTLVLGLFPAPVLAQSSDVQARVRFEQANLAFDAEKYGDALRLFEEVMDLIGPFPELSYRAAQAAYHAADYSKAEEYVSVVLETDDEAFKATPEFDAAFVLAARIEPLVAEARAVALRERKIESSAPPMVDPRDGRSYRAVQIGGRVWMAENLGFDAGAGSTFYGDNAANGSRFGRLYTWPAALGACPAGWRLPSDADWEDLMQTVSDEFGVGRNGGFSGNWSKIGAHLKSTAGWKRPSASNERHNGLDNYGFSVQPAGYVRGDDRVSFGVDEDAYFWSATRNPANYHRNPWIRTFDGTAEVGRRSHSNTDDYLSVRCVRD